MHSDDPNDILQILKLSFINKNSIYSITKLSALIGFAVLSACSPTKYVPEGEYLLNKYDVNYKNRNIKKKELGKVVKQKPNKKILGLKFHLSLYNLSKEEKDNKFNNWLRTIGEEPVIYNETLTNKSKDQLSTYLSQKGYFNAVTDDSTSYRKKKAKVSYFIQTHEPYLIRNIDYSFEDTSISSIILEDTLSSLIHEGQIYDVEVLQKERIRLERLLKNEGYYTFSRHYVHFEIDSALTSHQLDILVGIKKYQVQSVGNRYEKVPHRKYRISRIFVFTDFNPQQAMADPSTYYNNLDTAFHDDLYFISDGSPAVLNPKVIIQSNYIKQGDYYNLTNVEQTNNHLSSLKIFRLISIQFNELERNSEEAEHLLDCRIQLAPFTQQSYTIELEGTNSAGNLGGAVNLLYQHKNLFKGAEILNLKLKGALEALTEERFGFRNTLELGAEASLSFPKFLLPFLEAERFVKKHNPKTTFTLAYNFQRRPEYIRSIANVSIGYNWKGPNFSSHIIRPIDLNAIKIQDIDDSFLNSIKGTSLEPSYQDVMITGLNYSYIFNNQNINKKQDFVFFRLNAETTGNILYAYNNVANSTRPDTGGYNLFGLEYAQFIKGDIDLRYHQVLAGSNDLVYRGSVGVAFPYWNSSVIPFTKQYFSGGANGLRAWHVRSLGPGSYADTNAVFYNQTADIKIEANLEYRFKLFWVLEGALFLDVGNIWSIKEDEDRPGAFFEWNKFYKDLAVGTGLGTRFDFSFFVFRLDVGMKLRDPRGIYFDNPDIQISPNDPRWIPGNRKLSFHDDFTLHIAIGYPF